MKTTIIFVVTAIVLAAAGLLLSTSDIQTPENSQGTIGTIHLQSLPEPTDYAVDVAGILTSTQISYLNSILKAQDDGGKQIAVVIVKTTAPTTIEDYSIKLAEKWQVGDKTLDNGVIIIIATDDRKVRLEVGYGLEGDINDAAAGRIIDNYMISHLKTGNWYDAILGAIAGINERI